MIGRRDLLRNRIIYFLLTFTLMFSPFSASFAYGEDHSPTEAPAFAQDAEQGVQDADQEEQGAEPGEENLEPSAKNPELEDLDEPTDTSGNTGEEEGIVEPESEPLTEEIEIMPLNADDETRWNRAWVLAQAADKVDSMMAVFTLLGDLATCGISLDSSSVRTALYGMQAEFTDLEAFQYCVKLAVLHGAISDLAYYAEPPSLYLEVLNKLDYLGFNDLTDTQQLVVATNMRLFKGYNVEDPSEINDYRDFAELRNVYTNAIDTIKEAAVDEQMAFADGKSVAIGTKKTLVNFTEAGAGHQLIFDSTNPTILRAGSEAIIDNDEIYGLFGGKAKIIYLRTNVSDAIGSITNYAVVELTTTDPAAAMAQSYRPEAGRINMMMLTFDKNMNAELGQRLQLDRFAQEIRIGEHVVSDLSAGNVLWITPRVAKVTFPDTDIAEGETFALDFSAEVETAGGASLGGTTVTSGECVADTFGPVGKIVTKTGTVSTLDVVFNELIPVSSQFGSGSAAFKRITLGASESGRREVKTDTLSWSRRDGRDVMTIRFASWEKVEATEYFKIEYTDKIKDYAGNSVDAKPKAVAIGGGIGLSPGTPDKPGLLTGTTSILNSVRELAGGKTPKVAILSSSDISYQSAYNYFYENTAGAQAAYAFALFGFEPVIGEITHDTYRDEAIISRTMAAFEDCTAIFGPGGDQSRNSRAYLNDDGSDTELMRGMRQVFYSGGVISGASAGDHSLSNPMIVGGDKGGEPIRLNAVATFTVDQYNNMDFGKKPALMPGYGFLSDVGLTDSHFDTRNRLPRLLVAMKHSDQHVGIGVSENTGISIRDGIGQVYGASYVMIADTTDAEYVVSDIYAVRNLRLSILTEGDRYDFNNRVVISKKSAAGDDVSVANSSKIFEDNALMMRDLVRSGEKSAYGTDDANASNQTTVVFIKDGQTKGYYNSDSSYAVSNMLVNIDVFGQLAEMQSYVAPPPKPVVNELTNVDHVVSMKLVNFPNEPLTSLEYCVLKSLNEDPTWYKTTDDARSPELLELYRQQDSMTTGQLSFVPVAGGSEGRYLGLRYKTVSGGDTLTITAKPFPQVPKPTITPTPPISQAFRPEAGMVNMLMVTFDKPMDFAINEEMALPDFAKDITVNDQSIGNLAEGTVTWITTQVAKVVFPATPMKVGDELTIKYNVDQVKAANGMAIEADLKVDPCVADSFAPVGKVVPKTGAAVSEMEIVFNELIASASKSETAASAAISAITLGTSKENRRSLTPTTLSWSMRDGRDVLTVGLEPVEVGETEYFEVTYTNLIKDYSGNAVDARPKAVAIGGSINLTGGLAGTTEILHNLRELSGGKTPKVAILSSSDSPYNESYDYFYENTSGVQAAYGFALFGFEPVIAEITCDTYNDDDIVARTMKAFEDCTAVFGPGGDQSMNSRAYLNDDGSDTELMRGMRQVFHSGGVISGSSAGDHSLSNPMITGGTSSGALLEDAVDVITVKDYQNQGTDRPLIIPGYGFVSDYGLTDSHVDARSRLGRLLVALKHTQQEVGIGVGENTSIAIVDGIGQVFGAAGVMITDVSKATYPQSEIYAVRNARLNYLTAGDKYDFINKKVISAKPIAIEKEGQLTPSADIFPGSLAGSRTTGIEGLIRDLIRNTSDSTYGIDKNGSDLEAKKATLVITKDSNTTGYDAGGDIHYAVGGLLLSVDAYTKLDEMLSYESPDPKPGPGPGTETGSSRSRNKNKVTTEDPGVPLAPIPTGGYEFRDVTKTHWAYAQVKYLAERGYVTGKTDVLFAPSDQITRAEFITILARLSGDVLPTSYSGPFTDVAAGAYYDEAVAWGVNAGVINGASATTFLPNNQIQRQEMASMVLRYAEFKHYSLQKKSEAIAFTDQAQIHAYAREAVEMMQQADILSGYEDNSFRPLHQATRAEAAKMLAMVHQLMTGAEI